MPWCRDPHLVTHNCLKAMADRASVSLAQTCVQQQLVCAALLAAFLLRVHRKRMWGTCMPCKHQPPGLPRPSMNTSNIMLPPSYSCQDSVSWQALAADQTCPFQKGVTPNDWTRTFLCNQWRSPTPGIAASDLPVIHIFTASRQEMPSVYLLVTGLKGPKPDTNAKMLQARRAAVS